MEELLIPLVLGTMVFVWFYRRQSSLEESLKETKDNTKPIFDTKEENDMEENVNTASEEWAKTQLEKVQEETKPEREKTRERVEQFLKELCCQYTIDDDGDIIFTYQGGNFIAIFYDGPYLMIRYFPFYSVESYNKDKMEKAVKLVNKMNQRLVIKVIYNVDPESGELEVYCEQFLPMKPEMPELGEFLRSLFNAIFQLHHDFVSEMDKE